MQCGSALCEFLYFIIEYVLVVVVFVVGAETIFQCCYWLFCCNSFDSFTKELLKCSVIKKSRIKNEKEKSRIGRIGRKTKQTTTGPSINLQTWFTDTYHKGQEGLFEVTQDTI